MNGETRRSLPLVSVIVPVFNDAGRLRSCLLALAAQSYPRDRFEVIVVDNGSTDGPEAVIALFPFADLIAEPGAGSYAARNRGIDAARGNVIAFTDSDCIPAPTWIEAGVAALTAEANCGMVGGAIELFYACPPRLTDVEQYEAVFAFPQQMYVTQSHYAATANLFTWRRVFDQVGRFQAGLRSGGDREWGNRLYAQGLAQKFSPAAVVYHPARRTYGEIGAKTCRVAGGFYTRHRGERWLLPRAVMLVFWGGCTAWRAVETSPKAATAKQRVKVRRVILYVAFRRIVEMVRLELGFAPRR